ncbi:hypothetical protein FAZ15_08810 [Sphingobacterium olei]|uniref:Uncharacterized protein n=1 Tax=Sphingobacterium olei TaxID=2571155 RepID=A0A4U0P251_9SPHI|nr:hypothetical protein [Sphingobacterium olei]TJZ61289.1 hypothetical protein FAZ15_08810 [Sphingobacterium olei]
MKERKFKPTTKVYRRMYTPFEMIMYYRMMLLRISRHLSPIEISFLMGKRLDFIRKVETFKFKKLTIVDLLRMERALDLKSIGFLFSEGQESLNDNYSYQLTYMVLESQTVYQVERLDSVENAFVNEFRLIDKRHDIDPYTVSTSTELDKIHTCMRELFAEGYFKDKRDPYEIYTKCCTDMDQYLKPKNVLSVLQGDSEQSFAIQRMESKDGAFYMEREV